MPLQCFELAPETEARRPYYSSPTLRPPRLTLSESVEQEWRVRGFVWSVLFHGLVIALLIALSPILAARRAHWVEKHWEVKMISTDAVYLPQVGGGHEGGGGKEAGQPSPAKSAQRSVSYPGKQVIISNVPNPTNYIQTILQPDLPHQLILNTYIPIPNKVLLAAVPPPAIRATQESRNQKDPVVEDNPIKASQSITPKLLTLPEVAPDIETPHLTLPTPAEDAGVSMLVPPAPPIPVPQPAVQKKPPQDKTTPSHPSDLPLQKSTSTLNQLVVSPFDAPAHAQVTVPNGEARGQFTITPQPLSALSLSANLPTGGLGGASDSAESFSSTSGTAVTGAASSANGKGSGGPASANGDAASTAAGGSGKGDGAGSGHSTGPGIGRGSGASDTTGTGAGAGAGPGSGPFAGMTIQGAQGPVAVVETSGSVNGSSDPSSRPLYGMTVVSAGNSGGGLADFGVFGNEAVFTVYLHPTGSGGADPPWPLQYAILDASNFSGRDVSGPVIKDKVAMTWPPELLTKYVGQQIVLYAEIDTEGKIAHPHILQSPSRRLSDALLQALDQWVFWPGTMNGKPVALKIVLGVPITSQI